jgi:acid stress chaperone HdeA
MITSTRRTGFAVVLLGATLALTACSGGNKGGDTTCGEFTAMSSSQQEEVIRSFLASKGNTDPAGGEVTLNQASAALYCATVGTQSSPISDIDG